MTADGSEHVMVAMILFAKFCAWYTIVEQI